MKSKSTVTLDELDVKCLTELPIILEVLSSVGNKLTRIYTPLYDSLLDLIVSNLPKGWKLGKDNFKSVFYPFTDQYRRDDILTLYSYFSLYYDITLAPIDPDNSNAFYIQMGFYYDGEDEENKRPCHYFEITRHLSKKAVAYKSFGYYQALRSKLAVYDFDVRILHPEAGGKQEDVSIIVYDHTVEAINNASEIFKDEVVLPFIQSLK